jgi:acetyl esterase
MLDPQTTSLLATIAQRGTPPTHRLSPEQARMAYLAQRVSLQPTGCAVGKVEDIEIPGPQSPLTLRVYWPSHPPKHALPAMVFFHGGGFVVGDLDSHDQLCRSLCQQANCVILAVDYRLAPEHRYPAAALDCLAATRWVHAHAAELGIDPMRIAVGGDSAGGQLAAVVAQGLRDDPAVDLAFQLLIYPIADALMQFDSIQRNGQGYLLGKLDLSYYYDHYFGTQDVRAQPMASPLRAKDLSALPPALVLTAGFDPLIDEGLAYADALSKASVATQYICFSRQIHGFIRMGKVIDEANLAISTCAIALRRALHREIS